MRRFASDIAFTPSVKAIQSKHGSRSSYARTESGGSWETTITPELEDAAVRSWTPMLPRVLRWEFPV